MRVDEVALDAKIPLDDEPNPNAFAVSPPGLLGRLVSGATMRFSRDPKPRKPPSVKPWRSTKTWKTARPVLIELTSADIYRRGERNGCGKIESNSQMHCGESLPFA
ncbi:hypothetical protein [Hyphomicrobium sp. 99]|uniref:hypothetical protein n=1 Tax=Hyphomicrobium sp. 99 TaxID=1163419 RepID=UPI0005F8699D|nr:hypothetical protein [Hyphomicrobium sp. 99]